MIRMIKTSKIWNDDINYFRAVHAETSEQEGLAADTCRDRLWLRADRVRPCPPPVERSLRSLRDGTTTSGGAFPNRRPLPPSTETLNYSIDVRFVMVERLVGSGYRQAYITMKIPRFVGKTRFYYCYGLSFVVEFEQADSAETLIHLTQIAISAAETVSFF